ncbi:MAG: hypothetical protein ABIF71_12100, partial [Planctomycetota bacterium]
MQYAENGPSMRDGPARPCLDAMEIPAGAGGALQFRAQDIGDIEGQQMQKEGGFIAAEGAAGEVEIQGAVKLAEAVLEGAAAA